MSHLDMRQFMCRSDNYGVIVHDSRTGATASIDAPDAEAVETELRKFGRQLTHILPPIITKIMSLETSD